MKTGQVEEPTSMVSSGMAMAGGAAAGGGLAFMMCGLASRCFSRVPKCTLLTKAF